MNKKVKSLLVAGLLVLGMGFAKVDSYAAEVTNSITNFNFVDVDGGPLVSTHTFEDGKIKITIRNVGGYSGYQEGTYEISANWDTSMIDMKSINVVTMQNAIEESKESTALTLGNGQASSHIKVNIEQAIKEINLNYDLAPVEDGKIDNPPLFDVNSIYEQYKANMSALGTLDNGIRTIGKDAAISADEWKEWVEKFNNTDNKMLIEKSNEEYKVYISLDNKTKGELVETIKINFYDASNKGWLPEITPGTGQALAVGGIVIGAVAVAGLLVNNKRKKDEE